MNYGMWDKIASWVASIGALNWGLKVFKVDLANLIELGSFETWIYFIIGVAGLYLILRMLKLLR